MMRNFILIICTLIVFFTSCQQPLEQQKKPLTKLHKPELKKNDLIGKPILAAKKITESFSVFWEYYNNYIELYKDFNASDVKGGKITRIDFLKKLSTGNYFPVALYSEDNYLSYKLAVIPAKTDESITAYLKKFSSDQLEFCKLEGKPVPNFNFNDVNGKHYSSESIKGKIVLFKCWFIRCGACVKEMPALNEIVKKYKNRDDILFISLAIDNRKELQKFLATTKFDYATIPNQERYMADQLHVSAYPTHFIINKKGELVRMLPDETKVIEAIEIEIAK